MAFGLSIESHITIEDAKGEQSVIKFNHPTTVDIGALKSALVSTAELIDAVINGKIVNASISIIVNLVAGIGLKATAIAGADIEEGVQFSFETSLGALTGFRIPTFSETFLSDAGVLDAGDTDVDNFIQRMISGLTDGLTNISPSDAYGDDITAYSSGLESFASSRG